MHDLFLPARNPQIPKSLPSPITTPASAWPDAGEMLFSEAVEAWFASRSHLSQKTLDGNRSVAWSIFRFVRANLSLYALRKLHPTLAAEWLQWLQANPPTQAKAWSLPRDFSRESVALFLQDCDATPEMAGKTRRRKSTVNRFWRDGGSQLCKWLGQTARPTKKDLPRPRRTQPLVPTLEEIAARWRDILIGGQGEATASQRRRVVLTQGFLLLTGLRKQEGLLVEQRGLQDSFLLVPGEITKPRVPKMICINGQALGVAAALRGQLTFGFAEGKRHRLLGWPYTPGHWDHLVAKCGPAAWKNQQQSLRQRCATWVRARDPDAERVQLGHGGGDVVQIHYLDKLRELPALMNQFVLPDLDVPGFAWPAPIQASHAVPRELYAEFDELMDACEPAAA
jgi:hypothetical protein